MGTYGGPGVSQLPQRLLLQAASAPSGFRNDGYNTYMPTSSEPRSKLLITKLIEGLYRILAKWLLGLILGF